MMLSLKRRIEALERSQVSRDGMLYTAYFTDGSKKHVHPGEVLQMAIEDNGQIDHFEESAFCGKEGCLEGLANVLIGG